jgi:hypothetical protein
LVAGLPRHGYDSAAEMRTGTAATERTATSGVARGGGGRRRREWTMLMKRGERREGCKRGEVEVGW